MDPSATSSPGGEDRFAHLDIVAQVLEGSWALIDELPAIAASLDRFQQRVLSPAERHAFARAALTARYGEGWAHVSPVRPAQLLKARRAEDLGEDLWTTVNVVQENLMQGGLEGRSARSGPRVHTRRIHSVVQDLRLNRALWRLTERLAAGQLAA